MKLLTLKEDELVQQARELASKIDAFLIEREKSVLSKLIALGGSMEQESFEVQVKVKVREPDRVIREIQRSGIEINAFKHYHQYDEYFTFDEPSQGRLRFRENNLIDEKGEVESVRSRLTLLGRSAKTIWATMYCCPAAVFWHPRSIQRASTGNISNRYVRFQLRKTACAGMFDTKRPSSSSNLDHMKQPRIGHFLEIKSRTWSRQGCGSQGAHGERTTRTTRCG